MSFKEALVKSRAEGRIWEKEYYEPLCTKPGALLEREILSGLGLDLQFKIIRWDEFERNLEFTDTLNVGRWSADPAYMKAVEETADDFVTRVLGRLRITKPPEPKGVTQDSPEYTAYLKQDAEYLAKKQKFKELAVTCLLREAAPLTIGLIRKGISAILYPTTEVFPPASITATLEKFRDPLEGILKEEGSWAWCPYSLDRPSIDTPEITNKIALAFQKGVIQPVVEELSDKELPQKASPPPSTSQRLSPTQSPILSGSTLFKPPAPTTSASGHLKSKDAPTSPIMHQERDQFQKMEREMETMRAEMENMKAKYRVAMRTEMENMSVIHAEMGNIRAMHATMKDIRAMLEAVLKAQLNGALLATPPSTSEEQRKTPSLQP